MYNQDIRRNITNKSKDEGVKNLIAICSVDKLSKEICSSIDFWGPIFKEHEFYLPQIIPSTHTAWISTFENEKLLKRGIDEVITFLDTEEGYATVQSVGFPYVEILGSIKDIDKNELLIMDNDKKNIKTS